MKLTPIEVNHAVRFLKYAEIHINHHKHPTTSSSTLYCVKQQAALQKSSGLLPQLFEKLTPHKIPLDGTTIEFHRHFASIVVNLFDFWIRSCPHHETLALPAGDHSGPSLLLETTILSNHIMSHPSRPSSPKIEGFFDELRKNMTNELASWLDIATTEELSSLLFGKGIRDYEPARTSSLTDQLRGELDELSLAFYTQTKDYVVHLSLHPFALDDEYHDTILDFLDRLFRCDCEYNKTRSFRAELRQKMDESAISSSSPPFILTSELACRLRRRDREHCGQNCWSARQRLSFDDDTILRICTFIRMQLSRVYLPDLFRKAGRSNEQYLHAFESLLSQRRLFGSSTDKVSSLDLAKGTPTSIGRMG
ncbi:hypothetical protein BLNAU_24591 [Blattamonas nauphoetae]|uniref:Uncharacterized protein n=1 Tax=Blattamonas nauphoetae TaxID=2049346 RepID=A0ABQ9WM08_9EUKA|nr:hypothetical protein BLNAU_24591 [Blattamonas nauphoetae]